MGEYETPLPVEGDAPDDDQEYDPEPPLAKRVVETPTGTMIGGGGGITGFVDVTGVMVSGDLTSKLMLIIVDVATFSSVGDDTPDNVTVPVCVPAARFEELAVNVNSCAPAVPDVGYTVSHEGSLETAVQLSVEPGAPPLEIVDVPIAWFGFIAAKESDTGLALMTALGSQ